MPESQGPGMHAALLLAYAGYLFWLAAGLADFLCHRRTDLPHTSGVRESALHLLQLALIGGAITLCLALRPSWTLAAVCALLLGAHAIVGYVDTRQAYGRRPLLPFEQHVHSVLDMAPVFAFVLYFGSLWLHGGLAETALAPRDPALAPTLWAAVLAPAALLCVLPALAEFRAALRARATAAQAPP